MKGSVSLEFLEDTQVGDDFFFKGEVYDNVSIHHDGKAHEIEVKFTDGSVVKFPYIWFHTAFTLKRKPSTAVKV